MLNNYQSATWNFFKASHGKGAADGVGAVLKRTADRMARQAVDMADAKAVYDNLQGKTSMKLYFITNDAVGEAAASANFPDLQVVPGTMILHQLIVNGSVPGAFIYRDVSCFCGKDLSATSSCFEPKSFKFQLPSTEHSSPVMSCSASTDQQNETLSAVPGTGLEIPSKYDATLIGQHCTVKYDNKPYPGRILSVEESRFLSDFVPMQCIHSAWTSFFWPDKIKDICFYPYDQIVTLIPEPQRVADHGRS